MHQHLALGLIDLGALRLGDLVVVRVLVADEVEALLGGRGVEQVVDQLVRIGALGPADHAPHRGVPFVAVVPDDVRHLRPRQAAHLDLEAELAPFLRDQLRRLEFLRVRGLRPGEEVDLADLLLGILCEGPSGEGMRCDRGESCRGNECTSLHEASLSRAALGSGSPVS